MAFRLRTWVCLAQGAYFVLTGLWSLVSIGTFMLITGDKTDVWLVKTVGVLVIAIGATLLFAARRDRVSEEIRFLAVTAALALTAVDVMYVYLRTISPIYLLDAVVELVFVVAWFLPARTPTSALPKDRPVQPHRVGP